ncbi:unnamed protein product [Mesocestoides corti]|uniref:Cystatin domain-containing protein n=1 Tax=Mesocestoides corti TaxID=53468 RepID=A0A0R3UJQ3_MESCO|nr:unnamed protein product [Mesocestoides corti]
MSCKGVYMLLFVGLFLAFSEAQMGLLGGRRRMSRERLDSQEIQELVRAALKSSSPCSELVEIVDGTVQIVSGIKYQFSVRTAPKSSCGFADEGNPVSRLMIYLPAGRGSRPVYSTA